jgi:hypothetical protein
MTAPNDDPFFQLFEDPAFRASYESFDETAGRMLSPADLNLHDRAKEVVRRVRDGEMPQKMTPTGFSLTPSWSAPRRKRLSSSGAARTVLRP